MKYSIIVKTSLVLSGLIATAVGFGVLFIPHAFHASSGIAIGNDVNLLNEIRSPGGMVLISGLFILIGAFRAKATFFALVVSTVLYLSFGLSRIVSLVSDGAPNNAMLQILALELCIGALSAVLLKFSRTANRASAGPQQQS